MNALVRDLTLDEITAVSGGITEIVVTAERTSSGGSSPAASGDSRDSEVANRQRQLQSQNRKAPVPEEGRQKQQKATGKDGASAACNHPNIPLVLTGEISAEMAKSLNIGISGSFKGTLSTCIPG